MSQNDRRQKRHGWSSDKRRGLSSNKRRGWSSNKSRGLCLDKENGWLLGVCAGLANYSGFDPALVRVGTAIATLFMPKFVIAAYLLAWLLLDDRKVWRKR